VKHLIPILILVLALATVWWWRRWWRRYDAGVQKVLGPSDAEWVAMYDEYFPGEPGDDEDYEDEAFVAWERQMAENEETSQ
jgi:hypothetical protein